MAASRAATLAFSALMSPPPPLLVGGGGMGGPDGWVGKDAGALHSEAIGNATDY